MKGLKRKSFVIMAAIAMLLLLAACGEQDRRAESAAEEEIDAVDEMEKLDSGDEKAVNVQKEGSEAVDETETVESAEEENGADVKKSGSVSTATASFGVKGVKEEKKELELLDYGWYFPTNRFGSETIYVKYCAIVHNPNTELVANFPKVNVTLKNGDGTVLTTDSQTGSIIMPEDTVTILGNVSVPTANLSEDTQITFDVECDNLASESFSAGVRTTDFMIENVSEQEGSSLSITGEITNNTSNKVDMVNISIVLRKEGEIVYMDSTYVDDLLPGKAKAFEITEYNEWPEHDTIDVSVQEW